MTDFESDLLAADWDRTHIDPRPVDLDRMPDTTDRRTEDHAHDPQEDDFVENGEALREFTHDGITDQGHFGDGAYVPAHWWTVESES